MPLLPPRVSYYHPAIEGMSREELLGLQWRRLKQQLDYAYYRIPFYRKLFQQAKLAPDDIKGMEDFRRLPLIDKATLLREQQGNPPYGSHLGVREDRVARFFMTSGTSGKGQEVLALDVYDLWKDAALSRGYHWLGIRRGDLVVHLGATSLGPMAGMDTPMRALNRLGANVLHLGVTYSTEQKLAVMQRFSPRFLIYVTSRLTAACKGEGINPRRCFPRLKGMLAGGSTESLSLLLEMEEFWGARVFGIFGSTEGRNGLGITCEMGIAYNGKQGVYHLQEDRVLVEVLDRETREPVSFGEEGEVVLTNLLENASPLLRFATNDRVVYSSPQNCPCGRPFAGVGVGSVGRYDDMLRIRGMNFWPSAADQAVFAFPEVAEYQGRVFLSQERYEEMAVSVEFRGKVPPRRRKEVLASLAVALKDHIGLRMSTEEVPGPLPRYEEQKPRRWKDERRASW